MMELALFTLTKLPIDLLSRAPTESAKWTLFEENYKNIEIIIRYILERASKSNEDHIKALDKLDILAKSFSSRQIATEFNSI